MTPKPGQFPEFPVVEGAQGTIGERLDKMADDLDVIAAKMTRDRSYSKAKLAIGAAEVVRALIDDGYGWFDDLDWEWEPEE